MDVMTRQVNVHQLIFVNVNQDIIAKTVHRNVIVENMVVVVTGRVGMVNVHAVLVTLEINVTHMLQQ